MKSAFVGLALLGLVLLPRSGFAAGQPYAIDVILPITGVAAFLGRSVSTSLGVVEDAVNKSGGINGQPIHFSIADDQSNPQVAVQLVNGIIASKAPVMIGSSLSATCGAIAPLLKEGPVDFCLSPGIHPAAGSYVFSPAPSTLDLAIGTARYMQYRGWNKVAFIFSTDSSGQDGEHVIGQVFAMPENTAVSIVDIEHFATTDLSVAAQIAHVKASGAQALYVWSTGTASATVLHAAQDAGLDLPIVTSYSNATYDQMKAYQPFMPKELLFTGLPSMAPDQLPKGALRDAVAAYDKAFAAAGVRPEVGQQTAWDAAMLIVSALRKLGTNATAPQIRDYLASLHGWVGTTGTFDFRAIPQRGVNWSAVMPARWDPAKATWVGAGPLGG